MAEVNKISAKEARSEFSTVVNRVAFGKERIRLTRRGKGIVAMVPIEDAELLEKLEDMIDIEDARAALAEGKKKGFTPLEDFIRELGL